MLDVDNINARAGLQLVEILTRQLTVVRIGRYIEHHIAVIGDIRVAFGDQLLGDLNDFRNMVGSTRLHIRAQDIQRVEIFVHLGNHAIHQRHKAFAIFISTLNDFVVDIGDIAHVL